MSLDKLMEEIVDGGGITLSQAAALFPSHRGKGRSKASTVWRWITEGSKASDGSVVKLEAAKFGGRYLTTRNALVRFSVRLEEKQV